MEWGYRSKIIERFNRNLVEGLVITLLKVATLEADKREEDRRIRAGAAPGNERVRGLLNPAPHEAIGISPTLVKRCLMPPRKVTRRTGNDERLAHVAAAFVNRGTPEPEEDVYVENFEEVEDRYPLIAGITLTRQSVDTDRMLEYRVEICPRQLVEIISSGIKGLHPDPGRAALDDSDDGSDDSDDGDDGPRTSGKNKGKKKKKGPFDKILAWIPASIVRQVHPEIVEEYEEKVRARQAKKTPKKRAAASASQAATESQSKVASAAGASTQAGKPKPKAKAKGRTQTDDYDYLAFNSYASAAPPHEDIDVFKESSLPLRNCGFLFTWPDPDDPDCLIVDSERDDLPTRVDYAKIDALGGPMSTEYTNIMPSAQARPRARQAAVSTQSRTKENVAAPVIAASQTAPRANAVSQPTRKRKRPVIQAQPEDGEPWNEPEDDGPLAFMNSLIDGIFGNPSGGGRKEKAMRGRGRPRASAPTASASAPGDRLRNSTQKDKGKGRADVGPPLSKRRKTLGGAGASATADYFGEGPSSGPAGASQSRAGASASASASTSQSRRLDSLFAGLYSFDDPDSRSPSPLSWNRSSSPAPLPPSSSMPTPSSSRFSAPGVPSPARLVVPARRKSLPSTGQDVIELTSDSDDDVIHGPPDLDYDSDEAFWSSLPGFDGKPSHYSLRKARESQQLLLDTAMDSDSDSNVDNDAMEQDRDLEELNGLRPSKSASVSGPCSMTFSVSRSGPSKSAAGSRSYRNPPMPSSSQESMLDSENGF